MLTLIEMIDIVVHGFIFSYAMSYLTHKEKISKWLLLLFTIIFSINKYFYMFSAPSVPYFLVSNIFICLILGYVIIHSTQLLLLFYSLAINVAYYCSFVIGQTFYIFVYQNHINISPTFMTVFLEFLFVFFVLLILKNIDKISLEVETNKYLFISILTIILILFLIILRILYLGSFLQLEHSLLLILIVFLTFLSLSLFIYVSRIQKQKYEEEIKNQELLLKEKTYYQVERSVQNLSSLRHDMLYVLTHIQHLNEHQNESIDIFINKQLQHMKANDKPILTGNQTLNYIIFENMNYIRENEIDFVCNQCEKDIPIQKIDFYTIMSLLLENAIYHAPHHSQVNLRHGFINKNYYVKLSVHDSFEMDSKEIKTIENTLHKYNGNMYITHEDHFTELNVFI